MEILGFGLQDFIFTIFLPFIFFYLFLYGLLRKTKILGDSAEANRLNSLLSLVISALGIFSLYYLGLTVLLPILAAFAAVASFVILYLFGTLGYSKKKISSYSSGDAFKNKDERKFDTLVKKCSELWKKSDRGEKQEIMKEIIPMVGELEPLAEKLGKPLSEYEWYNVAKAYIAKLQRRGESD